MKQRIMVFVFVISTMLACSVGPIFNHDEATETSQEITTHPELPPQNPGEDTAQTADDTSGPALAVANPIAFVAVAWCVPGSGREILSMQPDGSNIVCLTKTRGEDNEPNWSDDGQKIVFISDRNGGRDIYLMNPDGSDQQQITFTEAEEFYPAFSPDGTSIVYTVPEESTHHLETMDLNTGEVSIVEFEKIKTSSCIYPDWSPDGKWLLFSCFGGGQAGIYKSHPNGSDLQLLQAGPLHYPVWSPDGKMIALDGEPAGCKFEVYVMNADGSGMRQVTEHPEGCGGYNKHPAWSPDGKKLIYSSYRMYDGKNGAELFSINLDGSDETQLTFSYQDDLFNSPLYPVWSLTR